MGDHIEKAVAENIEIFGVEEAIDKYQDKYGHKHSSHRPNLHGFKNNMKLQGQWHKTRDRLQAKLAAKHELKAKPFSCNQENG